MAAGSGGKRFAGAMVGQLTIWHGCQSLEHELRKFDDASLSSQGLACARIAKFPSTFLVARELSVFARGHFGRAGDPSSMLRSTHEDLPRTYPFSNQRCPCKDRYLLEPRGVGDHDFCPHSWIITQLRNSPYSHATPFRWGP